VHCNSYFPLFLLLYGAHGSRQGQLGMGFVRALPVQRSGRSLCTNVTTPHVALHSQTILNLQAPCALCPASVQSMAGCMARSTTAAAWQLCRSC